MDGFINMKKDKLNQPINICVHARKPFVKGLIKT
jgi:hypothetical protein